MTEGKREHLGFEMESPLRCKGWEEKWVWERRPPLGKKSEPKRRRMAIMTEREKCQGFLLILGQPMLSYAEKFREEISTWEMGKDTMERNATTTIRTKSSTRG
jgi:hypothetical protein